MADLIPHCRLPSLASGTAGAMIYHQYTFANLLFSAKPRTKRQNNPVKSAIHNKQVILGADGLIAIDAPGPDECQHFFSETLVVESTLVNSVLSIRPERRKIIIKAAYYCSLFMLIYFYIL